MSLKYVLWFFIIQTIATFQNFNVCVCVYTQRTNILPQTSCAWILNSPESAALSVKWHLDSTLRDNACRVSHSNLKTETGIFQDDQVGRSLVVPSQNTLYYALPPPPVKEDLNTVTVLFAVGSTELLVQICVAVYNVSCISHCVH